MRVYLLTICLIIFLLPAEMKTQHVAGNFLAYGPESRYLSGFNYRVFQSKTGYLWIGTVNGLLRFDGKRYKIFTADFTNPDSPSDNIVTDICEDSTGNLWISGLSAGVSRYDQRTGLFKKYPHPSKDANPIYGVVKLFVDTQGSLWMGTAGRGLGRYNEKADSFSFYYPEPAAAKDGSVRGYNDIKEIIEDPFDKNILWIGSFHGLFSFNKTSKQFVYYRYQNRTAENELLIHSLAIQKNGKLWIGTWGETINCFDLISKKFADQPLQLPAHTVNDIKVINDSTLYLACFSGGLLQVNTNHFSVKNITPLQSGNHEPFIKNDIHHVSITKDAGIFVGAKNYLYQQHPSFNRLATNIKLPLNNGVSEGLLAIEWDEIQQQYWVCTYYGIYVVDSSLQNPVKKIYQLPNKATDYLIDFCIDYAGRKWVVSAKNGLQQLNDQHQLQHPSINLPDSFIKQVRQIAPDHSGNLWLYAKDKIGLVDLKKNSSKRFEFIWDKEFKGNKIIRGAELLVSPEGDAWLLSQQGCFVFNRSGQIKHLVKKGNSRDDLSSTSFLTGAFIKAYDVFWFTSGDGLQVLNYKNFKVISAHTVNDGLPSMFIRSVATDSLNRVWVGTASGLGFFDPSTKIWRYFNRFDGLETDFLDGRIFVTANNKLAIAQKDGIALYDPTHILIGKQQPTLRITSILINEQPYKSDILPEFETFLKLPYNQNNISIEYAAMDWLYPYKTSYRYKVEGIEGLNTWMPNEQAQLNFAGLQPGKYKLHIRALGNNGVFSNELVLPIQIEAPFWQKTWFIILMILLAAAIVYGAFRYRLSQINRVHDMRNKISRNLHDDIGASMSNIGILNELALRNVKDDADKTQDLLTRAAEDIQHISENLGDIVWNINPMFDDLNNLFIRMKRYAADMAEGKNITCRFDFPNRQDLHLPMDKRRDFYLVFKEAINNMVKHSGATTAEITIYTEQNKLFMTIKDDGVGFDIATVEQGNGLNNMTQRARQLGGQLKIESGAGIGCKLSFWMPF